jgi:exosome complex component CSL4
MSLLTLTIEKMKRAPSFPGDQIAFIEEFESGKNTYIDDGSIRSSTVGHKVYDLKRRIVRIEQENTPKLPKIGDIIVGYIDMLFGSMISVRILYINGVKSISGFSAISTTRGISLSGGQGGWSRERGDRRSRITFRVGDIIRGRVVSLLNSNIHITIAEKDFGVVYTLCYNCGGNTVRVNNAVKCVECGTYEDRKLTSDYGIETFSTIHNGKTLNGGK